MSDHRLVVEFDQDSVRLVMTCNAPHGSDCRLTGPVGCTCERWSIVRAHEDAVPYHRVDTVGGAEILHWMHDGGECNYARWINESDDLAELNEDREAFVIAAIPVEAVWDEDGPTWKRVLPK